MPVYVNRKSFSCLSRNDSEKLFEENVSLNLKIDHHVVKKPLMGWEFEVPSGSKNTTVKCSS